MLTIFGFDPDHYKCVPCINAKRLATVKRLPFEFISVTKGFDPDKGPIFDDQVIDILLDKMSRRSKVGLTMPQVFWGKEHIGGFDQMREFFK